MEPSASRFSPWTESRAPRVVPGGRRPGSAVEHSHVQPYAISIGCKHRYLYMLVEFAQIQRGVRTKPQYPIARQAVPNAALCTSRNWFT